MAQTTITRRVEFDAGHRVPDHKSKCRHPHGHRYVLEATVSGEVKDTPGDSSDGMIVDFGDLKAILTDVIDRWDHAFICDTDDPFGVAIKRSLPDAKVWFLSCSPTVENLARAAHELIYTKLRLLASQVELVSVRLYETPNCWADYYTQG